VDIEFLTQYKCEVCAGVCPAYISHDVEIRNDGTWRYIKKIHPNPTYFLDDIMFCSAECSLKWWQDDKEISV